MTLNLYIRFQRDDDWREPNDPRQFAHLTFDTSVPGPEQRMLVNRFMALSSCARAIYYPVNRKLLVVAVNPNESDETKFVGQVTACAREHYKVKRVIHAN
jgi:hypothetical protein